MVASALAALMYCAIETDSPARLNLSLSGVGPGDIGPRTLGKAPIAPVFQGHIDVMASFQLMLANQSPV